MNQDCFKRDTKRKMLFFLGSGEERQKRLGEEEEARKIEEAESKRREDAERKAKLKIGSSFCCDET